jgi:ribosome-dependent ATPase
MVSFVLLALLAIALFHVPVKGSLATLALGTLLYVFATTGFGQLVSTFTRTQVAAVFATAILSIIPAVNFSGLLTPVSSLSGAARLIGLTFPPAWYQPISVGAFTKALGLSDLWFNILILACFAIFYLIAAQAFLKKQEA